MWGKLRKYIIAFATSLLMGLLSFLFQDEAWPAKAYVAVESFAPWNLVTGYVRLLTISDDPGNEFPSLRAFEPVPALVDSGKSEASIPYLSRGASYFLRPITALIDLLLNLFFGAGFIGFLVSAAQVALGAGLMILFFKRSSKGFYFYTMGLPVGSVLLGSIAAIPLWLIVLLALWLLNAAVALIIQSGSTAVALMWIRDRAIEAAAHEPVSKAVAQVVNKVEKTLIK